MKKTLIYKKLISLILLQAISSYAYDSEVIPQVNKDEWHGSLTPYLWLPTMNMNSYYNDKDLGSVVVKPKQMLDNLTTGFMGTGEVHYGKYGFFVNAVYSDLTNNSNKNVNTAYGVPLNISSSTNAKMGIYSGALTYTAFNSNNAYIDLLAGARYLNVDSSLGINLSIDNTDLGNRNLSTNMRGYSGIIGSKGLIRVNCCT